MEFEFKFQTWKSIGKIKKQFSSLLGLNLDSSPKALSTVAAHMAQGSHAPPPRLLNPLRDPPVGASLPYPHADCASSTSLPLSAFFSRAVQASRAARVRAPPRAPRMSATVAPRPGPCRASPRLRASQEDGLRKLPPTAHHITTVHGRLGQRGFNPWRWLASEP